MPGKIKASVIGSPFLCSVALHEDRVVDGEHPFTVPAILRGLPLEFSTPVTFLVGENGSGKSTFLEALGWALGFSAQGGNRTNAYAEDADGHALGRALKTAWRVTDVPATGATNASRALSTRTLRKNSFGVQSCAARNPSSSVRKLTLSSGEVVIWNEPSLPLLHASPVCDLPIHRRLAPVVPTRTPPHVPDIHMQVARRMEVLQMVLEHMAGLPSKGARKARRDDLVR
jgi:hypothetical protein